MQLTFNNCFDRLRPLWELTFPEIESVLLNCLPRPPFGGLHFPQVVSSFDNTRDSIQINVKKDNRFY